MRLPIRCPRDTTRLPGPSSTARSTKPKVAIGTFIHTGKRQSRPMTPSTSCTLLARWSHARERPLLSDRDRAPRAHSLAPRLGDRGAGGPPDADRAREPEGERDLSLIHI